jgi:hypothetical protein
MSQEWPWGRYFDGYWEADIGALRLFALHHYSQALFLKEFQSTWPYYPLAACIAEDATFSIREKGYSEEGPDRGNWQGLEESPLYVVWVMQRRGGAHNKDLETVCQLEEGEEEEEEQSTIQCAVWRRDNIISAIEASSHIHFFS